MNFDLDTDEGMANAINWQQHVVNLIKEGGKWGVPRVNGVYTLHHSKKLAIATARDSAIDKVFEVMGWEVKEQE